MPGKYTRFKGLAAMYLKTKYIEQTVRLKIAMLANLNYAE